MDSPEARSGNRTQQEATTCLRQAALGDKAADARLFEIVYADLHELAAKLLRDERAGHTLQPTALVHEAWIRLFTWDRAKAEGKHHFFGVAAKAMRQALLDHARRRRVRPDRVRRATIDDSADEPPANAADDQHEWIEKLDSALNALELRDQRKARVVELHVFGGLPFDDVAGVLGVSAPTVDRDWAFARAWLKTQIGSDSHW